MVILETTRDGYTPEQVEEYTCTVGEFIKYLEEYDENEKIVFSNDRGYTYGAIKERLLDEI